LGKKFAVRYEKTHGKLKGLPCVQKNARQTIFSRAFSLCRAPYVKRTAKKFFAVRPIENARQRFSRTAKLGFPVVFGVKMRSNILSKQNEVKKDSN
jgi:hypothetical protein